MRWTIVLAAVLLLLLALPATALPPGDSARGEKIYQRCQACLDRARPHRAASCRPVRPTGRQRAGVSVFAGNEEGGYRRPGVNDDTLDKFLKAPTKFIPGTRMGYAGIKDDQERADLLAYLKQATRSTSAQRQ